jgi:hypothetical protein
MDRTIFSIAGAVVAVFFALWVVRRTVLSQVRYVIGRDSFRVLLGSWTVRRIRFDDIQRVRKPNRELRWKDTENWRTDGWDSHRVLVLERRSGLFPQFVITPKHRYEMRAQLRQAIAKSTGRAAPPPEPGESDEPDLDV